MPTDVVHPLASPHSRTALDRLGDEIAELAAHLEAATARLLALIRDVRRARAAGTPGFRSCADVAELAGGARPGGGPGAGPGGARPGDAAAPGPGAGARGAVVRQGPGPDPRGHAGDRGAAAGGGARRHGRARRADRAGLAARGPAGRGAGGRAAAREPRRSRCIRTRTAWWCSGGGSTPEVGALLLRALDAAREKLYQQARGASGPTGSDPAAEPPTLAQQQADALALLAETALAPRARSRRARASGTRWWSTSTPRCWRTRSSPASRCSRTGRAFPRKRRGAWRATRAGW